MKMIAVRTDTLQENEFVFGALEDAVAGGRFHLADIARAVPQSHGVEVVHSKGKLSRLFGTGIDDGHVRRVCDRQSDGSSYVFALGDEAVVDAVARRVRTVGRGTVPTFDVAGDELKETSGADATYALESQHDALDDEGIDLPLDGFMARRSG